MNVLKMKKVAILLLCSFACFSHIASASRISEETVHFVKARVSALVENSDSSMDEEQLSLMLQEITRKHGVEGIAWLGFKEPLILESFIASDSLGLHNIAVALLKQGSSEEEMAEMLLVLVEAQVRSGLDPFKEEHMEWLKEGCKASSISLSGELVDQLLSVALVNGIENGEAQVKSATFRHRRPQIDLCKLIIKKISYLCFIKDWDNCISKHKPDYSYKKSKFSYSSSGRFGRRNWD